MINEYKGDMDFRWFPFDIQKVTQLSYSGKFFKILRLKISIIIFSEFGTDEYIIKTTKDIIKHDTLDHNYEVTINVRKLDSTENFSSLLELELILKRRLTNHFLQTFLPSMMLCMASTGSLFIPSHIVPGRMGLAITSFLSLISIFNGNST